MKRQLVCEATLKVIEKRLEQSDAIIFVRTKNSLDSVWCKYELNYFHEFNKPVYVIDGEKIEKDDYAFAVYPAEDYIAKNYKSLALLKGKGD